MKKLQSYDASTLSLLMIVFDFPPAAAAGVHRPLRFTKYLGEFGCRPSVLTRHSVSEQDGNDLLAQVPLEVTVHRIGRSKLQPNVRQDARVKVQLTRVGNGVTWLRNGLKSLLRPSWELVSETPDQYVHWARKASRHAIKLCKEVHYDAVYTTGPPHSAHLVGFKVHQKLGLPWIADFRDPWARHNWAKTRNPWGRRLVPHFERKVVRCATRVILNNETSRDEFRQTYSNLDENKFISIPNGFDPELLSKASESRSRFLRQLARTPPSKRTPIICHPGSLYRQREPRPILEAIKQLRNEGIDVKFQQIGNAATENNPLKIGAELGIEDLVEMLPKVSHSVAFQHMSQADILLVIQPDAPLQVPGKLYEMLLFDTPIIAICDSKATNAVLETTENAWSVPSHNSAAIAKAIRESLSQPIDASANNRERSREIYNGRNLAESLRNVVAETIENQR